MTSEDDLGPIDLDVTSTLLAETVVQLRELAVNLSNGLRTALDARDEEDKQVLDVLLSDSEECHQLTDRLMDEIVKRFDLLSEGEVTRNRQGWPLVWSGRWPVEERAQFLKAISRFSSNFAPFFGRLLTPLVNGVRVAGPFSPAWMNGQRPKLVLLDGEGLGHTPKSSSSISTAGATQERQILPGGSAGTVIRRHCKRKTHLRAAGQASRGDSMKSWRGRNPQTPARCTTA